MGVTDRPAGKGFRLTATFWVGLGILCVGTAPLLVVMAAASLGLSRDPNPNPIGFGLLAALTFLPGVGMMVGGLLEAFNAPPHTDRED